MCVWSRLRKLLYKCLSLSQHHWWCHLSYFSAMSTVAVAILYTVGSCEWECVQGLICDSKNNSRDCRDAAQEHGKHTPSDYEEESVQLITANWLPGYKGLATPQTKTQTHKKAEHVSMCNIYEHLWVYLSSKAPRRNSGQRLKDKSFNMEATKQSHTCADTILQRGRIKWTTITASELYTIVIND